MTFERITGSMTTQRGTDGSIAARMPAFFANKNGVDQINIGSGVPTLVTWAETFDTNNNFAANRFTPTVQGIYYLNFQWTITNSVDQTSLIASILKNGNAIAEGRIQSSGINRHTVKIKAIILANGVTDFFEAQVVQSSGFNQNISGVLSETFWFGFRFMGNQ